MSVRMIRSVLAALAIATMAFVGTTHAQTQVGDAYILFNYRTGEFRMNPGNRVAGSEGLNSMGVEMDPAIGSWPATEVPNYPSGTYFAPTPPMPPPPDPAIRENAFGFSFATFTLPNVSGGGSSLNRDNLVIGSPWVIGPIPGTTAVYASTIPGYVGLPEFSFGNFGPTNLTQSLALASLGATTEGGFATGNRVYSMQNVVGTQFFKIYTVPEPSTLGLACAGIATLGASAWRKRKLTKKA